MRVRRLAGWLLMVVLALGLGAGIGAAHAGAQDDLTSPDWLEARGLSLINLVGQVPEEMLHGAIVTYGDNAGIVVYEAGTRIEETVVVTATIYPRIYEADWAPNHQFTQFGCLGQKPIFDHMGSVVPPSVLRIYTASGTEVTAQILRMYITHMDLAQPRAGSLKWDRYQVDSYGQWMDYPLPMEPDGLHIPANSGCQIQIPGMDYYPLTGVFALPDVRAVEASVAGSQGVTFQSYIGPGGFGIFTPLMNQLRSRYSDRHGRIRMDLPAGASHLILKFPPTPADPYADQSQPGYRNAPRLSGGTHRLSGQFYLSADLTFSAAFPLGAAWRDQDQAPGAEFLPLIWAPAQLAPPEYVIPHGVAYDACFTQGDCPEGVLEAIHDAVMDLEILYLSVARPVGPGQWVPLKMAGPAWSLPGAASEPSSSTVSTGSGWQSRVNGYTIFFPLVANATPDPPHGDCPCGWFDAQGQMLDYYASP